MSATRLISSGYDSYEIQSKLGCGAYGMVYKGLRQADQRPCVIKEINLQFLDEKQRQSAINEGELLRSLEHPYIVKYFDMFIAESYLYIVMEYCENGDLLQFVTRQKNSQPLHEARIWVFFLQMLSGLAYIHSQRILHRDFKTMNMFLTKNNTEIRIGDLGIAKVLNETGKLASTMIGTPYFLSPEICEEKPYSDKSDVWSLGCILYQLCTQKHPFEASNQGALIMKILKNKVDPLPSEFSREIQTILSLILTKDPQKRPSANQLLKNPIIQEKLSVYKQQVVIDSSEGKQPLINKKNNQISPRKQQTKKSPQRQPEQQIENKRPRDQRTEIVPNDFPKDINSEFINLLKNISTRNPNLQSTSQGHIQNEDYYLPSEKNSKNHRKDKVSLDLSIPQIFSQQQITSFTHLPQLNSTNYWQQKQYLNSDDPSSHSDPYLYPKTLTKKTTSQRYIQPIQEQQTKYGQIISDDRNKFMQQNQIQQVNSNNFKRARSIEEDKNQSQGSPLRQRGDYIIRNYLKPSTVIQQASLNKISEIGKIGERNFQDSNGNNHLLIETIQIGKYQENGIKSNTVIKQPASYFHSPTTSLQNLDQLLVKPSHRPKNLNTSTSSMKAYNLEVNSDQAIIKQQRKQRVNNTASITSQEEDTIELMVSPTSIREKYPIQKEILSGNLHRKPDTSQLENKITIGKPLKIDSIANGNQIKQKQLNDLSFQFDGMFDGPQNQQKKNMQYQPIPQIKSPSSYQAIKIGSHSELVSGKKKVLAKKEEDEIKSQSRSPEKITKEMPQVSKNSSQRVIVLPKINSAQDPIEYTEISSNKFLRNGYNSEKKLNPNPSMRQQPKQAPSNIFGSQDIRDLNSLFQFESKKIESALKS